MIVSDGTEFPNNIVVLLAGAFDQIDPDVVVEKRPLAADDNVQAIGVYAKSVENDDSSNEMMGQNSFGPTIERWVYGVQALVKDSDQVAGAAAHSKLVGLIEDILYKSQPLQLALRQTTTLSLLGVRRRPGRMGVRNRSFLQSNLAGDWYYLGTLEFFIETEKSNAP